MPPVVSVPPLPARSQPPTACYWVGARPSGWTRWRTGGRHPWPVDLSDQDAILAAVAGIDALDVLVHNAGVSYPATIADSNLADWRKTLDVNVLAPVALTQAFLPALRAAQGDVVFINSGAGINAHPGIGSYSVSKFALRGFADVLRAEEPALRVTSVHLAGSARRCSKNSPNMKGASTTQTTTCVPSPSRSWLPML